MTAVDRVMQAMERIAERNSWTCALAPLGAHALVLCFADDTHYCLVPVTDQDVAGADTTAVLEALIEGRMPADREPGAWCPFEVPATLH